MQTLPLFPPQGILVPTHLIFHPELPASVLVTWIQLRCLAREAGVTPSLSIAELSSIIGIHPARLQRHLAQLREISALSWHDADQGKIILSFHINSAISLEQPVEVRNFRRSAIPDSERRVPPNPPSYFPRRILGYLSFDDDEETLDACENPKDAVAMRAERARSLFKENIFRAQEHAYLSR